MIKMQKTIIRETSFKGIGLHTGCSVNVRILPAPAGSGITFVRVDLPGLPRIKAGAASVVSASYATTIGSNGVTVSTVEHLLAAFYGLGVDNAVVEIDGPEVPIMDGSASYFIAVIEDAGLIALDKPRKYLVVKRPIKAADRDKYVLILPSEEMRLTIDYNIDFSHTLLSRQSFSRLFSREVFRKELGSARTFGFLRDVEMLRANGLAKGGSLDNAVVIGETEILNEGGLRFPDEFVRHKVLDMMGDIALMGAPIIGRIVAHRSGHALNHRFVQEVLRRPGRWELTSTLSQRRFEQPALSVEKVALA
ncbi:MAG: UDP-3-O-acyl-N-acetylglucosamine deacetylase [Deltaproteobacteria bacterium]|nr:UDP-3-O-acyl-N-acetylglucosamine deacetylase [Deltaproteobacteria bacterium]